MATEDVVSMSKILTASAQAQSTLIKMLIGFLAKLWGEFDDWYDENAVENAAKVAADEEEKILAQVASTGTASARMMLRVAGIKTLSKANEPFTHPRKADRIELWKRPAEQFRYEISQGKNVADALASTMERAASIAKTDVKMADRNAKIATFRRENVTGYRRMIHPERSKTGVCGLCLVAADRIYSTDELLPIHNGCVCDVAPITSRNDPGLELHKKDLEQLYQAAGNSTAGKDLKRVKVKTVENGELGPILVEVGGKGYVSPEEANSRRRKRTPKLRAVDADSPTYLRKKENRTEQDSKRLLGIAQSQFDSYQEAIEKLKAQGVNGDDPRMQGFLWGRRRAQHELKKYQSEIDKAVKVA